VLGVVVGADRGVVLRDKTRRTRQVGERDPHAVLLPVDEVVEGQHGVGVDLDGRSTQAQRLVETLGVVAAATDAHRVVGADDVVDELALGPGARVGGAGVLRGQAGAVLVADDEARVDLVGGLEGVEHALAQRGVLEGRRLPAHEVGAPGEAAAEVAQAPAEDVTRRAARLAAEADRRARLVRPDRRLAAEMRGRAVGEERRHRVHAAARARAVGGRLEDVGVCERHVGGEVAAGEDDERLAGAAGDLDGGGDQADLAVVDVVVPAQRGEHEIRLGGRVDADVVVDPGAVDLAAVLGRAVVPQRLHDVDEIAPVLVGAVVRAVGVDLDRRAHGGVTLHPSPSLR
jgi:hypothetical protein